MTNAELVALLREARESHCPSWRFRCGICSRIDAALAEHDAVPPSEDKVDSAPPVVEWEQSHWMTYFNGFRIQVYPSRLDGGWWEFLVERDVHDPNERLIGQGTSKQAAMRGGIQAVKEWK